MPAGYTIPTAFTAIDRFTSPVIAMSRAMNNFGLSSTRALSRVERGFRQLMSPLRAVNKLMMGLGYYVGLYTIVSIFRNAIKTMADFQEAQINIQAVSPKTTMQNKLLAVQARKMAVEYGVAALNVSKLQYELIKMGQSADSKGGIQNIIDMTPSIVLGSKAMEAPEDKLAQLVGASMNLFKMPVNDVVDIFSKGLDISAMDWESFSLMISNSQQSWSLAGGGLEDLVGRLGILSNNFVHAASAGTGLKNITLDNAVAMKSLDEQLSKIMKSGNPLVTGKKMYGRKAIQSAIPLAVSLDDGSMDELAKKLNRERKGYTAMLNAIKAAGINYKLEQTKTAWQELIFSVDDGTGAFAKATTHILESARAVLLITADSEAARQTLRGLNPEVRETAERFIYWAKWAKRLLYTIIALKVAMILWRVVIIASTTAMWLWNAAWGASVALGIANATTVGWNTVSIGAFTIATKVATAAQVLWSAALAANPIVWIIVAVAALIILMYQVVKHWNEWGAAVSVFMGPLGTVISLIQSFRRNWDMLVQTFTTKGFLDGFYMIGDIIRDAFLMPIQQVYELMSNLPGVIGSSSAEMAELVKATRAGMGVNVTTDENGNPLNTKRINPELSKQESLQSTIEKSMVELVIRNKPDFVDVIDKNKKVSSITPQVGSTMGAQTSW